MQEEKRQKQNILSKMSKLDEIVTLNSVKNISSLAFPAPRCPLTGVAASVAKIQDALLLVVGTEECAYYTKSNPKIMNTFGGVGGQCFSVVVDKNDVTFGSLKTVEKALHEILQDALVQRDISAIFLVTTCVIEIIGDDFNALTEELSIQYGIPIVILQTEHFTGKDFMYGYELVLEAMSHFYSQECKPNLVNIVGSMGAKVLKSELCTILKEADIQCRVVNVDQSIKTIQEMPKARLNIVVNARGLRFAQRMQEKWAIPYVEFNKHVDLNKIYASYEKIFSLLGKALPQRVDTLYAKSKEVRSKFKDKCKGLNYVVNSDLFPLFELNEFLLYLGMTPLALRLSNRSVDDIQDLKTILKNPYVYKVEGSKVHDKILTALKPDVTFLSMKDKYIPKIKTKIVITEMLENLVGFELLTALVNNIKSTSLKSIFFNYFMKFRQRNMHGHHKKGSKGSKWAKKEGLTKDFEHKRGKIWA